MTLKALAVLTATVFPAALMPASSQAQQSGKTYHVGIMINGPVRQALLDRFRADFVRLGYGGETAIAIEGKFAEGQIDRHPKLAEQLVADGVDVILALGGPAARAAKNATARIPVVFAVVTDPVALGLVASIARPGGNVTGVTSLDPDQARHQMGLLKEALPALSRVAILSDDTIPGADEHGLAPIDRANAAAARELGLEPHVIKLKGAPQTDIAGAFSEMVKARDEAVLVLETPVPFAHQRQIGELAVASRIPAIFPGGQAEAGGLITYGTNVADTWPRMSALADRILKGDKPAEIPVEVVSRRELVINMGTARKLGIALPPPIVARADRIVE